MAILKESQIIGNYTVQSFIKEGLYNETYRISDKEGVPYFLKIFDPTRIPYDIKDKDGQILEITLSRKLAHRNVIQYVNDDIYEMSNTKYPYIVTQYFTGILVAEPLVRGRIFPLERALNITINALKGLIYMHSKGLLHNDIYRLAQQFPYKRSQRFKTVTIHFHAPADREKCPHLIFYIRHQES